MVEAAQTKSFEYNLNGVKFTAELSIGESGEVMAKVTMLEGQADFNTMYWGDDEHIGENASVNSSVHQQIDLEAAGINCQDVQFDHAQKMSAPGFEYEGTNKPTLLTAGETGFITLAGETDLASVNVLGFWGTNASTPDSELNAVAGDGIPACDDDQNDSCDSGNHDDQDDHGQGGHHGGSQDDDCDDDKDDHDDKDHDDKDHGGKDWGWGKDQDDDCKDDDDKDDDGDKDWGWGKGKDDDKGDDKDDCDTGGKFGLGGKLGLGGKFGLEKASLTKSIWGKKDDDRHDDRDEDCDDDGKDSGGSKFGSNLGSKFGSKSQFDSGKFYKEFVESFGKTNTCDDDRNDDKDDEDEDDDHGAAKAWHCFL